MNNGTSPAALGLTPIPIRGTLEEAWRLVRSYPRQVVLPIAVIQMPVALATSVITAVLFLTTFSDEPAENANTLFADGSPGAVLVVVLLAAVDILFGLVARGGAVVGAAAASAGRRVRLVDALDPAFTRMGGLILLALAVASLVVVSVVLIIPILILPYVLLRLAISFEAFMLEGISPPRAFRRSWELTRGRVLRLLGVLLLLAVTLVVPFLAIGLLNLAGGGSRTGDVLVFASTAFVQAALTVPLLAFSTATTTTFYLKARTAHERRLA